jgi:recombinational DNA repair protein RecT
LTHRPTNEPDRGQLAYAYAIAELSGGGAVVEVINQHDADRARADSPGANRSDSFWRTRTAEMWTKTAIRKLLNRMPRALARPAIKSRGDPTPEILELINAVCVSPEIYKQTLNDLEIAYPTDSGSIAAILSRMRMLYKLKKQSTKIKEPST